MSLGLHLTCEEHTYHICNHLNLSINNLSEKDESNLNPKKIKISSKGKRANTLNKGVKSKKRVNS
jgi:hypothetical protein